MASCPKCGYDIKGEKFCIKCGTKVSAITAESSAQIEILIKRIDKDPLNAHLYFELAGIYEQNHRPDDALLEYQKCINIDKAHGDAHLKSGQIYLQLDQPAKAEASFDKCLAIMPDNFDAQIGLLRSCRLQNKLDRAVEIGIRAVQKHPDNIILHRELVQAYQAKGSSNECIEQLNTLVRLLPTDDSILRDLVNLYEETGKVVEALQCYRKILQLKPDDIDATFSVGKSECTSGDYQKGIVLLGRIIKNLPEDLESHAHLLLAHAHEKLNNPDLALRELSHVSALYDSDLSAKETILYGETFQKAGQVALDRKDQQAALHYLKTAVKYQPENTSYRQTYNEILGVQSSAQRNIRRKRAVAISGFALVAVTIIAYYYITHGKIQLDISPLQSAKIYLDGLESAAFKPIKSGLFESATLDWGDHTLSVEADRFEKWEGTVSVGWSRTSFVKARIAPTLGSIEITSDPPGANLRLNSLLMGTTPQTFKGLQIGTYTLVADKQFYYNDTLRFELTKGNNRPIIINLKRGKGNVVIGCEFFSKSAQFRIGSQVQKTKAKGWPGGQTNYQYIEFTVDAGPVELFYNIEGKWQSTSFIVGIDNTVNFSAGYAPDVWYGGGSYYFRSAR